MIPAGSFLFSDVKITRIQDFILAVAHGGVGQGQFSQQAQAGDDGEGEPE
jgi:hypothetical protein